MAGTKKFLNRGSNRLGINHVLRHKFISFSLRQALFYSALYPHQANSKRVLGHFANAAHATVTKVVNIVDGTKTVTNVDQRRQHVKDVILVQYAVAFRVVTAYAAIELHASNA